MPPAFGGYFPGGTNSVLPGRGKGRASERGCAVARERPFVTMPASPELSLSPMSSRWGNEATAGAGPVAGACNVARGLF
jgi:hypothetical protein